MSNTKSAGIFIIVGGRKVRARVCRGRTTGRRVSKEKNVSASNNARAVQFPTEHGMCERSYWHIQIE